MGFCKSVPLYERIRSKVTEYGFPGLKKLISSFDSQNDVGTVLVKYGGEELVFFIEDFHLYVITKSGNYARACVAREIPDGEIYYTGEAIQDGNKWINIYVDKNQIRMIEMITCIGY